jgi:hypothetical protein
MGIDEHSALRHETRHRQTAVQRVERRQFPVRIDGRRVIHGIREPLRSKQDKAYVATVRSPSAAKSADMPKIGFAPGILEP